MVRTALLALALAFFGGTPYAGSLADLATAWSADTVDAGSLADPNGASAESDVGNMVDPNG